MRYAAIIFLVPMMFVFMFQAHAGSALQTGVIVSSAPLTTLAFNHRPMPRPRMRPVHVRRPAFGRAGRQKARIQTAGNCGGPHGHRCTTAPGRRDIQAGAACKTAPGGTGGDKSADFGFRSL